MGAIRNRPGSAQPPLGTQAKLRCKPRDRDFLHRWPVRCQTEVHSAAKYSSFACIAQFQNSERKTSAVLRTPHLGHAGQFTPCILPTLSLIHI